MGIPSSQLVPHRSVIKYHHQLLACSNMVLILRYLSLLSSGSHYLHGLKVPDERQRSMILRGLVGSASVASDVSVSALASQSASFVAGDLVNLTKRAISISRERTQTSQMSVDPLCGNLLLIAFFHHTGTC